jgi:hypothetical protein
MSLVCIARELKAHDPWWRQVTLRTPTLPPIEPAMWRKLFARTYLRARGPSDRCGADGLALCYPFWPSALS